MKIKFCSILFILLFHSQFSKEQSVSFEKSGWNEILKKAKTSKLPIFLDLYAVWCGPCKMLDKQVYPDPKVGKFMNKNFINVKVDAEKGEGIKLAEKFKIDSYPTLIFLNSEGEEMHRYSGFNESDEFIVEAQNALNKVDMPTFATLEKEYQNGKRDEAFLENYLKRINADFPERINNSLLIDEFISNKKSDFSDNDLTLLWSNMISIKFGTKAYQVIETNIEKIKALSGLENENTKNLIMKVNSYIAYYDMERAFNVLDESGFIESKQYFLKMTGKSNDWFYFPERSVFIIENDLYKQLKNDKKYLTVCTEFLEKAYPINKNIYEIISMHEANYKYKLTKIDPDAKPTELSKLEARNAIKEEVAMDINNTVWEIYEKGIGNLEWLTNYSKYSMELDPKATYIMDTYAHFLYQNGKKTDAIKLQEDAIKQAKSNNEDFKELEIELGKMKAGKL